MRLHALSVTAFGPFAGTVEVDLDDVGRDGLFLLWGPTGAGKTTLLDAVVFALYGRVPGARGEEKRLRSDHADVGTRTEVSCELTLGGERLRVVRRPEQQRPKKRGEGWATEQAKLVVSRLTDGGWEPVSTRIDEGSEHLRSRLGLDVHQFCQVVLLPQGDFARFLRAEPEHRAELLRTLFDVDRFARAEDWLAEERAAARDRMAAQRARLSTLLARVAQSADVDVPEGLAPELVGAGPGAGVLPWVQRVRASAGERLAEADARAAEAAAEVATTDAELAAARALLERYARRDQAARELTALEERGPALVPLRTERDAGRRAEPLRDVLQAAGAAALVAEQAADGLQAALRAWGPVSSGQEATTALARELRDRAAEARALLPEVERAAGLERSIAGLDRIIDELGQRCAAAEQAAAGFPARFAEQEERVAAARAAAAELPALRSALDMAEAALAAGRAAEALERQLAGFRDDVLGLRAAWADAREVWLDLRARRLDGMAAELAAGLADGADCPVCGATEHPRPATSGGERVTAADEDAAHVAADARESALTAATARLDAAERELAGLRARAATLAPGEQAALVEDLTTRVRAAAGVAAVLRSAEEQVQRLAGEREAVAARLAADREEVRARTAERDSLAAGLADLTQRLAVARAADPDLATRVARLSAVAAACEAVVAAHTDELRARVQRDTAQQVAEERAAAAGLDDVLTAVSALLPPGRLARLDRELDEHDQRLALLRGRLAEPELADLPPRPDMGSLEDRCAGATRRREEAVAELQQARRCTASLAELVGRVTAAELELAEERDWADQVTALADLAHGRGANTRRMRLQSFVLAARLEQVAEVASRRLLDMSGGRYTFLHSDTQGRHGARGGLGLDVFDEYTGVRRPTKTLSGGESFMASLALALGLADVVTAETGGVRIDTLFVDEGFGTLDAQALDAVMTVLDDLRRGGRTVGVISHLEELRTRIPTRLEVVAGRNGSRLAG
ncbi:AAA family ATPase [Blastococcus saxobsidens]|uniref:Nuclease SbcCD subunit C n=1 Tax=Blastococcus saxobsidens (strain DD2) TaxID=1146883 RepID=H6RL05_BLASD|nr:SMC family ATPase [Blastococcus saxobsidens]CCG04972.1 putative ATP-dependent dsDNA exonuclease [Blastococcus saxobsidens DD2]